MDSSEYINETKHAMTQLFEGIAIYRTLLNEIPKPVFVSSTGFEDEESRKSALDAWYEENKDEIEASRQKSREYFGLSFSNATLCGSILQIASMGIESFSNNSDIPDSCKEFIIQGQKAVKHCIGRELNGLPIGIIIYAARNQYNHWDDPKPHKITQSVFDALALSHEFGSVKDPVFDLSNESLSIYSHNILGLLNWRTYTDYETDIYDLL